MRSLSDIEYPIKLSFTDGSCGPIDWSILGITETVTVEPSVTDVAGRTSTFLVAYLVLSSVWIITSMSLIGEEYSRELGN